MRPAQQVLLAKLSSQKPASTRAAAAAGPSLRSPFGLAGSGAWAGQARPLPPAPSTRPGPAVERAAAPAALPGSHPRAAVPQPAAAPGPPAAGLAAAPAPKRKFEDGKENAGGAAPFAAAPAALAAVPAAEQPKRLVVPKLQFLSARWQQRPEGASGAVAGGSGQAVAAAAAAEPVEQAGASAVAELDLTQCFAFM